MENSSVRKYFLMLLPYFLLVQGVFVFYKIVPGFLAFYTPDTGFLIPYSFMVIAGILAIAGGFAIIFKKRWGIVLYLILCIISILYPVIMDGIGMLNVRAIPGVGNYWMIVLNIVFVFYLSVSSWKDWQKR